MAGNGPFYFRCDLTDTPAQPVRNGNNFYQCCDIVPWGRIPIANSATLISPPSQFNSDLGLPFGAQTFEPTATNFVYLRGQVPVANPNGFTLRFRCWAINGNAGTLGPYIPCRIQGQEQSPGNLDSYYYVDKDINPGFTGVVVCPVAFEINPQNFPFTQHYCMLAHAYDSANETNPPGAIPSDINTQVIQKGEWAQRNVSYIVADQNNPQEYGQQDPFTISTSGQLTRITLGWSGMSANNNSLSFVVDEHDDNDNVIQLPQFLVTQTNSDSTVTYNYVDAPLDIGTYHYHIYVWFNGQPPQGATIFLTTGQAPPPPPGHRLTAESIVPLGGHVFRFV